jgi:hypothetical protein
MHFHTIRGHRGTQSKNKRQKIFFDLHPVHPVNPVKIGFAADVDF